MSLTKVLTFDICFVAVTQDLQDQEEAGEEDEAEQAHPSLDPHENWQYHQVLNPPLPFFMLILAQVMIFLLSLLLWRYNAKRRHWRRTKLGFWAGRNDLKFELFKCFLVFNFARLENIHKSYLDVILKGLLFNFELAFIFQQMA